MSKTINYIDLCCGIGGFRLAIQEFEKTHKSHKFRCLFSDWIQFKCLLFIFF